MQKNRIPRKQRGSMSATPFSTNIWVSHKRRFLDLKWWKYDLTELHYSSQMKKLGFRTIVKGVPFWNSIFTYKAACSYGFRHILKFRKNIGGSCLQLHYLWTCVPENFRHTCLQSHLQISPPTPQLSYPKFRNPRTTFEIFKKTLLKNLKTPPGGHGGSPHFFGG